LNGPVIPADPSIGSEPVNATAISEKSLFTAADEMIEFGMNAAWGREYTPDVFLGIYTTLEEE